MAAKRNLLVLLSIFIFLFVEQTAWATTQCSNNWAGGACMGSITYTTNVVLTKTINASGTVTINSGQTLTTNGFSILTSGNFVNSGTILTGNVIGQQAIGGSGAGASGFAETNSLAGSGAGGGGGSTSGIGGSGFAGGIGGNTLVSGGAGGAVGSAGSNGNPSGAPPVVSNANIISWNATGFSTRFAGAGGGAGGAHGANNGGNGGNGAYGLYIQAGNIIAGTIHASGGAGSSAGTRTGGGGGGAGGFVLLATGGTLTAGTYTFAGGAAGAAGGSGGHAGGTGGAGNVITYTYVTPPLNVITILSVPAPTPFTQNVDQGQTATISDNGPSGGIKPYSYQWIATSAGSSTYNAAQANTLCGGSANTISCTFSTNTLTASGTYRFEFNAIDSGTTSNTVTSSSVNVVVKNTPTATGLTPSNILLDSGQILTYNVLISGGIGPFTANLVASNGTVMNTMTGQIAGTITFGAFVPPAGSDSYNAVVTDTGTTLPYVFSTSYSPITVNGGQVTVVGAASTSTSTTSTVTTVLTTPSTTIQPAPQNLSVSGNNVSTILWVSSNGPSTIDLNNGQAYLTIQSPTAGYYNITIVNVTNNTANVPEGYIKLIALRVNVSSTVRPKPRTTLLLRLRYNCSISSNRVAPYLLSNGAWQPITPFSANSSACTVSMAIAADPIVALFESISLTTTYTTTIAPTKTETQSAEYLPVALAAVLVSILVYLALRKRKQKASRPASRKQF